MPGSIWRFIQYLYFYPVFQKMQSPPQLSAATVVILATGGTIAGTAPSADDHVGYTAAQLGVEQLLAAVPALAGQAIEAEQLAQVDSKDMSFDLWRRLAGRVAQHLARPEVAGVVITHGTDTMEETAYLLQRVLAPTQPVILTGAMRPASARGADGPRNLADAVRLAREPGARGVCIVFAGTVFSALGVRKTHRQRVDAFGAGDDGPIGHLDGKDGQRVRDWPDGTALGTGLLDGPWPRVEIVTSHAGATAALVDALVAQGVDGIVAAGTGNGTLHQALDAALRAAQAAGVAVRRSSRVPDGLLLPTGQDELPASDAPTPVQARIELMLELMARRSARG